MQIHGLECGDWLVLRAGNVKWGLVRSRMVVEGFNKHTTIAYGVLVNNGAQELRLEHEVIEAFVDAQFWRVDRLSDRLEAERVKHGT